MFLDAPYIQMTDMKQTICSSDSPWVICSIKHVTDPRKHASNI